MHYTHMAARVAFLATMLISLTYNPVASQFASIGADPVTILCLVNKARAENCLQPLSLDDNLSSAAIVHSRDQAAMKVMSHVGSDGTRVDRRIERYGWKDKWQTVGENVAVGYDEALSVTRAWLKSAGHRKNILGDFTHFGFGYEANGKYWTQNFVKSRYATAKRLPECSQVAQFQVPYVDIQEVRQTFTKQGYCNWQSILNTPQNKPASTVASATVAAPSQPQRRVQYRPRPAPATQAGTVVVQPQWQPASRPATQPAPRPATQPPSQQQQFRAAGPGVVSRSPPPASAPVT